MVSPCQKNYFVDLKSNSIRARIFEKVFQPVKFHKTEYFPTKRLYRHIYCNLIGLNAISLPPSFVGSANRYRDKISVYLQ